MLILVYFFFFSSRRRHTRSKRDWSSDVCSSDLPGEGKRRVAVGVAPRLEVVADEDRIESVVLGGDREVEQLARAELLGRGLVAEAQGQRHAGGVTSACRSVS